MKSKEKMDILAKRMPEFDNKLWVFVQFKNGDRGGWIPSFEDLFRIIAAICHCEDEKYPNGQGRFKVRDFLKDCCEMFKPGQSVRERWLELAEKHEMPDRAKD